MRISVTFRPEINPYVALIKTRPERILCGSQKSGLTAEALEILKAKLQTFPKLALEFGSGSGGHLIERAQQSHDTLFVGSEIRFKRVFRTAEKADEKRMANLIICHVEARAFLKQIPDNSVDKIYVLYPDPWDKQRWKKNRLMSGTFLPDIFRALKPGGLLEYKTDHHEYFNSSCKELGEISKSTDMVLTESSANYLAEIDCCDNIESEFEKLFKSQGLPLCMLRAVKNPLGI